MELVLEALAMGVEGKTKEIIIMRMSNQIAVAGGGKMKSFAAVLAAWLMVAAACVAGGWEELKLPGTGQGHVSDVGMEAGGVLWMMGGNGLHYWDGEHFREPGDKSLRSGYYLAMLVGGGNRGLYATQRGDKEHQGKIYELIDGSVKYVTDFYYEVGHEYPGVYVSKSGKLFNWGNRFVATYVNNEWKRIEASLDLKHVIVLDTGAGVYFYHNGKLYSVDDEGRFGHKEIESSLETLPGRERMHGCLWGNDRMFLVQYGSKDIGAYDLNSGKAIDMGSIKARVAGRNLYDCFSAADGSVWLLASDPELRSYVFFRIGPDGAVERVSDTARLNWDNTRCWQFRESVLNASDGSIWFATPRLGLGRYHEGTLKMFGWKEGLTLRDCRFVFEDENGIIFAASSHSIYRYDPAMPTQETRAWVKDWQEYRLASAHPIRDSEGNIWMFRADREGKVSRWDGGAWEDFAVSFDTKNVGRMMADDQGHILIDMRSYPEGCFDISDHGVDKYENLKVMLAAAVNRGVKRFYPDREFQGCVVLEGGKIWFGYHNYNFVYHYDGERWDQLGMTDDIWHLYESPKYGMLLRTQGGRYYTYDRGQLKETGFNARHKGRWLLGPSNTQPYEESLYKTRSNLYLPVERTEDNKMYVLVAERGAVDADDGVFVRGDEVSGHLRTITPALSGGHFNDYYAGSICRFFGGRVIACDWRDTPLLGKEHEIRQMLEDREGNLWIDAGSQRRVFMKRAARLKIEAGDVPSSVGRSLKLKVDVVGCDNERLMGMFYRTDGGSWHEAGNDGMVRIDFFKKGCHEIEVVALDGLGAMAAAPLRFTVDARPVFPDTVLTGQGPFTDWDVLWEIPAKTVASGDAHEAKLFYRFEGETWKAAYRDGMVAFEGLEAGVYRVEVAACEEGRYFDPTPLVVEVQYEPNYERIVESRLEALAGDDVDMQKAAIAELKMAGQAVMPAAQAWITKINRLHRAAAVLDRLR